MKRKSKGLVKIAPKDPVRVVSLQAFANAPHALKAAGLAHAKDFKAAMVVDHAGTPRYVVFDTYSLWDVLCAADEKLEARLPAREYVLRNPVGWLIDAIEAHLPLNPKLVARLKKGIEEAGRVGVVPFERVKRALGLAGLDA